MTQNLIQQFGPIKQLGYLVADIHKAVNAWMQHQGVGPWTIIKNVPLKCRYLNEPSTPIIHLALSYIDEVQIELIQQINQSPSPYLSYINEQRYGLHHSAYLTDNIDQDVELAVESGHKIICDINMPDGGRYVYTQIPELGTDVFIEFLAATPRMLQMFTHGIAAAKGWQGEQDITVIDFAG